VAVSLPTTGPPAAAPTRQGFRLSAFGLDVEADFPLPGARPGGSPGGDLALRLVPADELLPLLAEPRLLRLLHAFDGCAYAMLEGPDGDILVCYGYRGLLHVSADQRLLRCAPTVQTDPHWQRVLLDTVLWSVSLMRGFELLHASAVETPAGIVAFVAMSGGGKSSLAAEFLLRGARLFCDDVVALDDPGGEVVAFPGPPVMNLPRQLDPAVLGARPIADFGDERWVEVDPPSGEARSLAAVVLVDRAPGLKAACSPVEGTPLDLLPHAFGLPHVNGRDKRRFELFSRVAATTPLLRLTADPSVPTGVLADLVDAGIAGA
jgi:hypothetical protein